jgi:hypothetical protein
MEGLTRRPQHTRTPMHGSIRKKYAMATDSMTDSFMRNLPNLLCAVALLALSASAAAASPPKSGTSFLETWKDPDAQPLQLKGAKVVAVVMMNDPKARRLAEDALAKEITKLGAQGVPMYSIAPAGVAPKEGESQTRALVEAAGAKGIVVMRPVDVNHRTVQTVTPSSADTYGGYWGGYYGIGWNDPWTDFNPDVDTDLVITIETFVFSLPQNKLVWTGTSETINPRNAEKFVHALATETAKELKRLGLVGQ